LNAREYMTQRLRLLSEGRELVGTPEEYILRHESANNERLRARNALTRELITAFKPADNLDLIGG
jgi:hypothetical protein